MSVQTARASRHEPITQFSLFLENKVGRLLDYIRVLKEQNIHVLAITSQDTTECAITRIIVDDPQKAAETLALEGTHYVETPVLGVELKEPNELQLVLTSLFQAEINIHYLYPFSYRPKGKSALILHLEDIELASQALIQNKIKVLNQRDISR